MACVSLNVSGVRFDVDVNMLRNKPSSRLTRICDDALTKKPNLHTVVNRPSDCFGAVLAYYQTNELHMPSGVCPGYFQKEMDFWEIGTNVLADCCSFKYHTFLNELATRQKFTKETRFSEVPVSSQSQLLAAHNLRSKVWVIVDNMEKSILSKMYFSLVTMMVVVSVLTLAFSTEPSLRRQLTKCELIDYMVASHHDHAQMVQNNFGNPDCANIMYSKHDDVIEYDDIDYYVYNDYNYAENGTFNYSVIDSHKHSVNNRTSDNYYDNDYSFTFNDTKESVVSAKNKTKLRLDIPHTTVPIREFYIIDTLTLVFFSIDLALRLSTCPSLRVYLKSFINFVDACALFGSFIHLTIISIATEYRYTQNWIRFIFYIQIFRALRLLRIVKTFRASKILAYSIQQNMRDISLMAILLTSAMSIFSCIIYFIEDRATIVSIPEAWYWAMITMTTVGYGDISPKTGFGRFVASICSVCGVILLAITIPMFVNSFITLYQYTCVNDFIDDRVNDKRIVKETADAESIAQAESEEYV